MNVIAHLYPEFSTIGNVAYGQTSAHILLYDGLRHEQADSSSTLRTLGGEVGLEDLAYDVLGYAPGVVGNGYDGPITFSEYGNRHLGLVGASFR